MKALSVAAILLLSSCGNKTERFPEYRKQLVKLDSLCNDADARFYASRPNLDSMVYWSNKYAYYSEKKQDVYNYIINAMRWR